MTRRSNNNGHNNEGNNENNHSNDDIPAQAKSQYFCILVYFVDQYNRLLVQ